MIQDLIDLIDSADSVNSISDMADIADLADMADVADVADVGDLMDMSDMQDSIDPFLSSDSFSACESADSINSTTVDYSHPTFVGNPPNSGSDGYIHTGDKYNGFDVYRKNCHRYYWDSYKDIWVEIKKK